MLFSPSDINPRPAAPSNHDSGDYRQTPGNLPSPSFSEASGSSDFVIATRQQRLDELVASLKADRHYHIVSYGQWDSHQVLSKILDHFGAARVCLTSWSITELPVKQLLNLIAKGLITGITCLFHSRVKINNPNAHQLADHAIARVRLTEIHAKTITIINDDVAISITTTANFSRNKRIEKYVISTHRQIAEADEKWILQVYEGSTPFR